VPSPQRAIKSIDCATTIVQESWVAIHTNTVVHTLYKLAMECDNHNVLSSL
jgi:hypothetical protein